MSLAAGPMRLAPRLNKERRSPDRRPTQTAIWKSPLLGSPTRAHLDVVHHKSTQKLGTFVQLFTCTKRLAWRRLPSLLYRGFPNPQAVAELSRFGNRRYDRFGNLRYRIAGHLR